MSRWCEPGRHTVPNHEAEVLRGVSAGSGLGAVVYACHECVRDRGLVPAAAFVGHRHTPPEHVARPV